MPTAPIVKLHPDIEGAPYSEAWHYMSAVGKMNFLEKSTRLDIAYAVHQCARFAAEPKESHAAALKKVGMVLNPRQHSFDCFVDADFAGNWDRVHSDVDPSTDQVQDWVRNHIWSLSCGLGFKAAMGGCIVYY